MVVVWPNHLEWLNAHGFTHLTFPGRMAMDFRDTAEAIEMTEIFYPHAGAEVRARGEARVAYDILGVNPPRDLAFKVRRTLRLALIASLVSPIREPQCGGAQAFLADLATGLARRGHDVDVFAASGSDIDGVRVVDVGVDASTLARVPLPRRLVPAYRPGAVRGRLRAYSSTRSASAPMT